MSFSLPERVTLKGPNFIREVFERGVGVEGFISFGIGNPAPEAIPVEVIERAFDEVVHSNPMSLLQYGPMQGDAHLAELTLERLVQTHKMNSEGQGLIISNGAGQLLGLVPITVLEPGDEVYMDEKIEKYILNIIFATRYPEKYNLAELKPLISFGASPRGSINLAMAAKCYAFIKRRGYVIPEDVRAVVFDVLRHRIGITYEAEAENITSVEMIHKIVNTIEVP